jgi:hypothetical protein
MVNGGVSQEEQRAKARVSVFQEFANSFAARENLRSGGRSGGQDKTLGDCEEPRHLLLLLKAAQEAVRLPWSTFSTGIGIWTQAKSTNVAVAIKKKGAPTRDTDSIAVCHIHGCGRYGWSVGKELVCHEPM